uniref:Uncharacterized protein n=1 Tax=Candidatus Kentrum sp. MB TaxID=2138164 RepID=A0A450XPV8_9GAMM|nr:MAG: hypothetical protein BECKMB1821G_GA0114241_108111 [Candidatus Kentron sp. MB]
MSEIENYAALLDELEKLKSEFEAKGIKINDFEEAISKLKRHTGNIEKIEANIEEIKEEIIRPIKKQLDDNKKAGKFSVYGFYIGGLGIVLSIFTILYTTFLSTTRVENAQQEIATQFESVGSESSYIADLKSEEEINNQIKLLLFRTISEVQAERSGSVDELLKMLNEPGVKQGDIIGFYIAHFPHMMKANNGNGVMHATLVLSKLQASRLQEAREQIEQLYQKIYNQPEWKTTSRYYEDVAGKAQIILPIPAP